MGKARAPGDNVELATSAYYANHLRPHLGGAPWILRITEHKNKPAPVLVVKERYFADENDQNGQEDAKPSQLVERGTIYSSSLRRCMPVIRNILYRVCDPSGIPLELQSFVSKPRITFRGNLPLDEEAGAKLALLCKLQARVSDLNRVELMAWRIDRFTREEAVYWLTRATYYSPAANRWAQAGMRITLGGQPGDQAIIPTLEQMRY